ncbi:aminoalcoholphosphotransferase [Actinidia rufa]|uniref:Aminoalcoholphosphotransferase n=1 Tax=Actinidia rufa TaxID=165716 RepID=A0A7J0FN89_9ERIC|nr:aminoalcoholphosphotransferase [Actinidia rufa]
MGSKQDGRIPQVHWGNCLIMDAMHLLVRYVLLLGSCLQVTMASISPSCFVYDVYQLEALAFGSTALSGRSTFWFWVISAVPFYLATWEHYFTNTLILPAVNGPTEGLMLIYLAHFFTAIVGGQWWAQDFGKSLPFLSWVPVINGIPTNRAILFLMIAFAVIPTILFNVYNVYKVVQARKGSMLLALAMLYPFVVLLGGVLAWDYLSPYDIIGNYPHLVVVGTGLAFGFLVLTHKDVYMST